MKTAIPIFTAAMAVFCQAGSGQNAPAPAADRFIETIETMKHSVAPLVCLAVNDDRAKILKRPGSAFFISDAGEFLTAAHVILSMQTAECPVSALMIPVENWRPEIRDEDLVWFLFRSADCRIDRRLDVARCRSMDDLQASMPRLRFRILPVKPEMSIPPDGTQVAVTGFPLGNRDPMTSRAGVAAYRTEWQNDEPVPELVLDRGAWPGSSGSPVYLSDGSVIGILIALGKEDGSALTIVRPVVLLREMLAADPKK